ncbi:MAG: hypothetical protein HYR84_05120 [Planctomycetes bacterium]|nr:hypothetical protein [Planctomycetota bacterium]
MKKIGALTLSLALLAGFNGANAGEAIVLDGLTSKLPNGWKMQKPSNNLRKFQAMIPKVDGDKEDAELAVFSFGPSGVEENIKRWKMQFIAPEGKTIDDVSRVEKYKIGKAADVVVLDIWGTFKYRFPPNDPRAEEKRKENFRRFNVMFMTDQSTFFLTLTGPAKTMEKHKTGFDNWIKGFK